MPRLREIPWGVVGQGAHQFRQMPSSSLPWAWLEGGERLGISYLAAWVAWRRSYLGCYFSPFWGRGVRTGPRVMGKGISDGAWAGMAACCRWACDLSQLQEACITVGWQRHALPPSRPCQYAHHMLHSPHTTPLGAAVHTLGTLESSFLNPHSLSPPSLAQAVEEWEAKEAERQAALASVRGGMEDAAAAEASGAQQFVAYVPLPEAEQIEQRVLEAKKAQLLSKYASEALQKEQQSAKELLNRR